MAIAAMLILAAMRSVAVGDSSPADDAARRLVDSIYAADLRRAAATPDGADDAALAAQMLEAARLPDTQADVRALLCDHAYRLGAGDPAGYQTAVEAMRLLMSVDADRRDECMARIESLYVDRYRVSRGDDRRVAAGLLVAHMVQMADDSITVGDAEAATGRLQRAMSVATAAAPSERTRIADRIRTLRERRAVFDRIAKAKSLLRDDPNNAAAAGELVRLYIVELDQPAEARKFSFLVDEPTASLLTLAALDPTTLTDEQAMRLGDWYAQFAADAADADTRRRLTDRAAGHYRYYLDHHPANDLGRTRARLSLAKLTGPHAAAAAERDDAAPQRPLNLLVLVDPEHDAVKGDWTATDEGLRCTAGAYTRIVVPVEPLGDYAFTARVKRAAGKGALLLMFPVGEAQVTLSLGGSEPKRGALQLVAGTSRMFDMPADLDAGRWYTVAVHVKRRGDQADIAVELDDKPLTHWAGPIGDLRTSPPWQLQNRGVLGFGSMHGEAVFNAATLAMTSGKHRLLRP